jgi:hypothetical protein
MKKRVFSNSPVDNLGNSLFLYIFFSFSMNNKFINNNGVNLLNISKNKKTKVESQIELLKQQEQEIISELCS